MHSANHPFSDREKEVLNLLFQGMGNKQIALELGISNRTVEFHLGNIYAKLGVRTRSEAILKLTESHLRKSTGGFQGKSTVAQPGNMTDNGVKSILRRIPVRKLYFIIAGTLLAILVAMTAIPKPSPQNVEPKPETPAVLTTSTSVSIPAVATALPGSNESVPELPPHTVNGYTAAIVWSYADASHVIFHVRVTGGDTAFGDENFFDRIGNFDLYDEYGGMLNTSSGISPAIDPTLYQFEFVPVTLLKGDHIKGQFAFELNNAPVYDNILARFHFDFVLPLQPDERFYPKQTVTASGMDILLDSVTITPAFTQIYLCFPRPSFADWQIGNQTILQMDGIDANPHYSRLLFDAELGGDRTAGSEPYWIPPVKNGRCVRSIFPAGSTNPTSFTLTIPQLEKTDPDILLQNDLSVNYPGLSGKQAYYKYLEEHGKVYKGPWVFKIELNP